MMGFGPGEGLTEDALARINEEAADSSYRKGGMNASIIRVPVSKETVMEKLHSLQFPKAEQQKEKRQINPYGLKSLSSWITNGRTITVSFFRSVPLSIGRIVGYIRKYHHALLCLFLYLYICRNNEFLHLCQMISNQF